MQKELLLAIILGSTLGLLVAFGIWKINSQNSPTDIITDTNITSPTPQNKTQIDYKDKKHFATNNEILEINGNTEPDNFVISISKNYKYITKADSKGDFIIKHELEGGPNQINIIYINSNNQFTQEIYTIVYSTEVDQNSSDLFIGSITDISENTIQIRKNNGDILQLTFDEKTSFASIIKNTKEIENTDLAIGDYIFSLGKVDEKNILQAKRILVGNALEEKIYEIKITNINDENINLDEIEDIFLYKENKVENTKLSKIDEDKNIIIIGEKNDDTIIANTIIDF